MIKYRAGVWLPLGFGEGDSEPEKGDEILQGVRGDPEPNAPRPGLFFDVNVWNQSTSVLGP
jgi:hypothetical protein